MITVKEYRGHIRNWEELCERLELPLDLSREEREERILVRAYETWGHEMADHMYGMFAFALWDDEAKKLFCLRDQFGTKPFYYYETEDGQLLYGTMIRQIIGQPGFRKELNEEMLQIYLSLTYVAGENTFFRGLKKLMPGHYLVWQDGKLEITRYWTPTFHPDESRTLEDWADEIHSTIKEIMPEVKTADETADSFLSGGVDSSYVLAMSDAKMSDSCGYEEERFDESGLARQTAEILGRKNSRCLITPEEYFGIVPYVMYNMEQPLGDASAIAFAIACNETAKHTKLCYSGEGADEFFGGYNMYRNAERYGDNLKTFYVGNTNIMKEDEKKQILKKLLLRCRMKNGVLNGFHLAVAEIGSLTPDTKLYQCPFPNVSGFSLCVGTNQFTGYDTLWKLRGLMHRVLSLPFGDDYYKPGCTRLELSARDLIEHLKDKEPSYYYSDVLIPNGKTLTDFIGGV